MANATVFQPPPGGALPCRQAPRGTVILPVVPIAWRHQQAVRRHTRSISLLILAHSLICSKTRTLPQPYPNQFNTYSRLIGTPLVNPLPINLPSLPTQQDIGPLVHLLPFAKKKHFNSSLPGLFHEPESPPLNKV